MTTPEHSDDDVQIRAAQRQEAASTSPPQEIVDLLQEELGG